MEEKFRVAMFGQKRLSREGGIEIVVKELCTRMAQAGCQVTCYNRAGHEQLFCPTSGDDCGKNGNGQRTVWYGKYLYARYHKTICTEATGSGQPY